MGTGEGASANALLKILEEPPEATTFILVSDEKKNLLPTILSRCQRIDFPPLSDEYIIDQFGGDAAKISASLANGNFHLARKLSLIEPDALLTRIEKLARLVLKKDSAGWRDFVNTYSRLAAGDREEYLFSFYLLQLWFRAAYRQRLGMADPLHQKSLLPLMEQLNISHPGIEYLGINDDIADITDALAHNYYIPLTLTNFLTSIQRRMSGS